MLLALQLKAAEALRNEVRGERERLLGREAAASAAESHLEAHRRDIERQAADIHAALQVRPPASGSLSHVCTYLTLVGGMKGGWRVMLCVVHGLTVHTASYMMPAQLKLGVHPRASTHTISPYFQHTSPLPLKT